MRPAPGGTDRPFRQVIARARCREGLSAGWQRPPERPTLGASETHVWAYESRGRDASRRSMRAILARYAGIEPDALDIVFSPLGKPGLSASGDCPGLRFNASASGVLALLALRRDHEVGIDVEAVQEIPDHVARRAMTPSERAAYEALPPSARAAHFCALWVAKEAVTKSLGRGLTQAFETFEALERVNVPHRGGMDTLWLEPLPAPSAGHAAAIASAAPLGTLRRWSLMPAPGG